MLPLREEGNTMQPLVALELDEPTHQQEKRVRRDAEVAKLLEKAGLPLLRIPTRSATTSKPWRRSSNSSSPAPAGRRGWVCQADRRLDGRPLWRGCSTSSCPRPGPSA